MRRQRASQPGDESLETSNTPKGRGQWVLVKPSNVAVSRSDGGGHAAVGPTGGACWAIVGVECMGGSVEHGEKLSRREVLERLESAA